MMTRTKAAIREAQWRVERLFGWRKAVVDELNSSAVMTAGIYYQYLMSAPRYQDPRRLVHHGRKVYSMHDEDGILAEVFRRIGVEGGTFVEFGVEDGLENNTLYLILQGWRGAWIDGSAPMYNRVLKRFDFLIRDGRVRVKHAYITAENVEGLFAELGVAREPDLLCIDIDNNDYWIWKAIRDYRPRVVAIEYNASFGDRVRCAVPYSPTRGWDGTNFFNASLAAMEDLGREKGYALVGCNFTGTNAFFVREDLVGDKFLAPYTAENHYEPPRYFARMPNGHPPGFGEFVSWDRGPDGRADGPGPG